MTKPKTWEGCVRSLCRTLSNEKTLTPRTVRYYKEHGVLAGKIIGAEERGLLPYSLTADDITGLVDTMRQKGYSVAYQKDIYSATKRLCEHFDNYIFAKVKVLWPADIRPNVDWLTPEQARQLLATDMTAMQRAIVTLELCAGLRRVELIRLTIEDIHDSYLDVHGKGHVGGKLRSVPIQSMLRSALDSWLSARQKMIDSIQHPSFVSSNLFVYRRGRAVYPYSEVKCTGLDVHLKEVCERSGISFSNHTLRRTFARQLWLNGAELVTISKILGHTSTEQTLRYIGANFDDMSQAMNLLKF